MRWLPKIGLILWKKRKICKFTNKIRTFLEIRLNFSQTQNWCHSNYRITNYNNGPFIYFIINDLAFLCHLNYYWAKTKKWHFSYDFFKVHPLWLPNLLEDLWIILSVLMHYDMKLSYWWHFFETSRMLVENCSPVWML